MLKERINEVDTIHAPHISESASDKLYNSIVRIEINNSRGTGFFMKINIKKNIKYFLLTNEHVIEEKYINSKNTINIFYGKKNNEIQKSIKLDKGQRFIALFQGKKDVTVIEILISDDIPENKYLMADLSYKYGYDIYKEGRFLLAGYPWDEIYQKERHIASGKIKKINGIEFEHSIGMAPLECQYVELIVYKL